MLLELKIYKGGDSSQVCNSSSNNAKKKQLGDSITEESKILTVDEPCVAAEPCLRYIQDDHQYPGKKNWGGEPGKLLEME